jgi:hypothetical protein
MKFFNQTFRWILVMICLTGYCTVTNATEQKKEQPYIPYELPMLKMKLSNDGTGIIKGISCEGCDYNFVKITLNTMVHINGVKVDIQRAKERLGRNVYVKFNPETGEVLDIRWSE